MVMKELEIIINQSGDVRIQVKGIKGSKCLELTNWIETTLGDLTTRELTDDYYESAVELNPILQHRQE